MAETSLQRSVFATNVLEEPSSNRHISGGDWQRVGVFSSPADVGDEIAISFDAISDAGVVGEVRLRTSTGQVTNPALVQGGPLTNGLVGFLVVSGSSPGYCYLEARGQSGNPGGIRVSRARLIDIAGVPAALLNGPHYPPGYNSAGGADLSIGANNVSVLQGTQAQIVATVTNNGPDDSGSFDVLVEIPNGGTLNTGASSSGAVVAGPNASIPVAGPVSNGNTAQLTFAFDIAGGATPGGQTLDVSVEDQSVADPNIGNDSSTMTLTITEPLVADMYTVMPADTSIEQGGQLSILVTVGNNGPDTSGLYDFSIDIPNGGTFNAGASTPGGTVNGGVVDWSAIQTIPNGQTDTLTAVFDIAGSAPLGNQTIDVNIFNQAVTDPNASNDTDSMQVNITAPGASVFPTRVAATTANEPTQQNAHTVTLPTGIQSGDLILLHSTFHTAATATVPTGFTEWIDETAGNRTMLISAKIAAGAESGTDVDVTTSGTHWSATNCLIIRGFHGSLAEGVGWDKGVSVDGAGAGVNPPAATATWGSDKNYFIALLSAENDDATVTAYPTGWSETQQYVVGGGGTDAGCTSGVATYNATELASHNPSLFSLSQSEGYLTNTLVLRPA